MIELFAVIFTLLCVLLTTSRNILSWPVGIVAIVLYAHIFFNNQLYADFILQIIFGIQSVIGYIEWSRNKEVNRTYTTKVERLSNAQRIYWLLFSLFLYGITSYLFDTYTNASLPYIDSLVATFSLVANYLLAKRKIESWYIWIVVDLIYIGLFIFKELYLSAILYAFLFRIAINGYNKWKQNI